MRECFDVQDGGAPGCGWLVLWLLFDTCKLIVPYSSTSEHRHLRRGPSGVPRRAPGGRRATRRVPPPPPPPPHGVVCQECAASLSALSRGCALLTYEHWCCSLGSLRVHGGWRREDDLTCQQQTLHASSPRVRPRLSLLRGAASMPYPTLLCIRLEPLPPPHNHMETNGCKSWRRCRSARKGTVANLPRGSAPTGTRPPVLRSSSPSCAVLFHV